MIKNESDMILLDITNQVLQEEIVIKSMRASVDKKIREVAK